MTFKQLPNLLTWSRLFLTPALVAVFLLLPDTATRNLTTLCIFLLAMLTDFLDGYLARRYCLTSRFGAFLDPVADKIIVNTVLLLLVYEMQAPFLPVLMIICREVGVSALREWMATSGKRNIVEVSMVGKFKTFLQVVAIVFLLYHDDIWQIPVFLIGSIFLWLAAGLSLISLFLYLSAAVKSEKV